ncbi:GNAT family N-acetyltransferase [Candidatus Thioglobus sp.]|nr:GNAT family N-acetyltransferase [Candidatus Thioglobus sp.]MDC0888514.1 GNAT family N-acetyltransferase [Candidatus Thioglobus sp.]MDC0904494.1 GNAT family N-acetyltransferase [Candidatus Thioglobus sp.]MDC0919690.1 GNAT family N-acetyltransferase [Candidatus Thioglobus sp.]MDC0964909.1 GNAT family N-acetyltransferase [Candidatus Thioglobus sp.]
MDKSEQILTLIKPFVDQEKILLRSKEEIEKNINDFILLFDNNQLVACAGLKDCQEGSMGEIYSLAVAKNSQNLGLSMQLLDKILIEAKRRKFNKVFALTKYEANWFLKHQFTQMKISNLPKKRQKYFNHDRNSSIFFKDIA